MRVQQQDAPQSRVAMAAAAGRDQFPIGMRVLAVDDDPVCLKLLDNLLRSCQYHVTTTNQAAKALALLRENKEMFDLVISDVHMPDMDGFKLLEQVGLEMDLPVIMLSANGETKTVMKGITHGACDYLLKPVRLEELKNIWQHVWRRRFSHRERNHNLGTDDPESDKLPNSNQLHAQGQNGQNSSSDNSGRYSKKRKDQNEPEDEDGEDNGLDNDEPDLSTQKKPRVVWSVELHRKFVAAVNQLGIDKAVPKRILELMNVEKLTRENVASHLQKYRLYLKRLSAVASQQASLAAAFGARDPSYLRMGMFEGLQSYHPLAASSQISPSLTSFQTTGGSLLNRGNTATLGLPGLSASLPNKSLGSNPLNELNKFQLVNLPGNPNHASLLNDQLPNELSFSNITNNALLPQTSRDCMQQRQGAVVGGSFHANPISFENRCMTKTENQSLEIPSSSNDILIGRDMKCQTSMFNEESKLLSFGGASASQTNAKVQWRQDELHESSLLLSSYLDSQIPNNSYNSMADPVMVPPAGSGMVQGLSGEGLNQRESVATSGIMGSSVSGLVMTNYDSHGKQRDEHGMGGSRMQGGYGSNGCSIDGLLNSVIKMERDDISYSDGDMGCDMYPLGACM